MRGKLLMAILAVALAAGGLVQAQAATKTDTLPTDESAIQQRMGEVEQRLLELAGQLEDKEPGRAAVLRSALQLSRERFLVSQMARVRDLLAQGYFGEAAELQQKVLDDLAALTVLLTAEQSARELAALKEAAERLRELLRLQGVAAEATGQLSSASAAGKPPTAEQFAAAAENQQSIRKGSEGVMSDLQGGPGSPDLGDAVRDMTQAEDSLRAGRHSDALSAQQDAERKLQAALQAVQDAIARMEAQQRAEVRQRVRGLLVRLADEQKNVHEATERADSERSQAPEPTRAQRLAVADLARRQEALGATADEALSLVTTDGTTVALPAALEHVKDEIGSAAAMLQEEQTGEPVRGLQKDVEDTARALLEVFEPEEKKAVRKPGQPDTAPQKKGRTPALLDVPAELRVLRAVQTSVNRQTVQLDAARGSAGELPTALRPQAERLSAQQAGVGKVVRRLAESMQRSEGGP